MRAAAAADFSDSANVRPLVQARSVEVPGNRLAGPAFPAAWLEAGAFAELSVVDLSDNAQLTGTLPPDLSWPNLEQL
jgi:hypothetical protein